MTDSASARRPVRSPPVFSGRSDDVGALRSSTFGRVVIELADLHGLRCSVQLVPADASISEANPLTRRITVSRGVLAASDEEQAWSAAHEVGHLVDARGQGLLAYLPWGFFAWLVITAAAATTIPLVGISVLAPVLPPIWWLMSMVGVGWLAVGLVAASWCGHRALLRLGSHSRPQEDAADAFAKAQGYPVTRAIAAMLDQQEGRPSVHPPRAGRQGYRRHRPPFERINVARD